MPGAAPGCARTCGSAGAEHAGGKFDARINLLDEWDHHQHYEGHRRHQVGQDNAGHVAAEMRLVQHGGERNAEGDRRNQHRQKKQQNDKLLAGEIPPRQRIGRRHAEQTGNQHLSRHRLPSAPVCCERKCGRAG
jgi:hypothetical protein